MRAITAYLTSAAVHLTVFSVLWCWQSLLVEPLENRLTSGQAVSLVAVVAAAESVASQTESLSVEISVVDAVREPESQPISVQRGPADVRDISPIDADVDHIPQPIDVSPEERARLEPPPPRVTLTPEPVPRNVAGPATSMATAATSWQADSQLGVEVDEWPMNLPTNSPPIYPAEALQAGLQGRVILRVVVRETGLVEIARLETSSGVPSLDEAALNAVRMWRFTPGRKRGRAATTEILVPVKFSIRR